MGVAVVVPCCFCCFRCSGVSEPRPFIAFLFVAPALCRCYRPSSPPRVLLLVLLLVPPAAMAAADMAMQAALQVVVGGGQAPAAGEQAELAALESEARDNAQRQRVLQRTGARVAG